MKRSQSLCSRAYAPRGLRREAAADWIGVSIGKFDEMVRDGRMPQPIRVDSCVIWDRYRLDEAFDALAGERSDASTWDVVDDNAWLDKPKVNHAYHRHANSADDKYSKAYEQWMAGKLPFEELPPGKYPNGMYIYAEGEWETKVRNSPLGKRELRALEAYFNAKGTTGYVKGGSADASERLAVRGYIQIVKRLAADREPYYGITTAGEEEWLRISQRSTP